MSSNGPPPRKMKKPNETGIGEVETTEKSLYDEETQSALDELDKYENELDSINELASNEILQIEQKYNKLRKPIFEKRQEVIAKLPHFWVTAFMNHPDLGQILDETEEDCLHHLNKLEVEEYEDIKLGYRISFHFDENPYFENTVLIKEFNLGTNEPSSHSTEIKWKEGFDLTESFSNATSSKSRKRISEHKSFFLWFNDNSDPTGDDIAEIIKDTLWPNPLQYYLVPDEPAENGVEEDDASDVDDEDEMVTSQDDLEDNETSKTDNKGESS